VVLPAKILLMRAVRKLLGATAASLAAFAVLGGALERGAFASPSSTSTAEGYDLGNVESPRALAMGGGLAATGASTVGLYQNPANMELSRVYHFEADGAFSPEARRYDFGGAIVDSANGRFGGGLGANFGLLDPDGIHRSWTDFRVALSYQLGDHLAFGLAGRYLGVDQDTSVGPFGASLISSGTPTKPLGQYLTFDAGMTVTLMEGLHIGIVGHNLSDPGVSLAPTTLVGAVGYDSHVFAIEADVLGDFTTWTKDQVRVNVGGEYVVAEHIPLRLGYRYDQGTSTHAVSAGLGYIGQQWSAEYSLRRDVVGDNPATMMSLSLRYFYDSTGTLGVQDPGGF
jgi:opacity protein-like surface antigen